ncbi:hypothetical protein SAMN02745196_03112, partial [Clostridium collagenovorans DSM 3089]
LRKEDYKDFSAVTVAINAVVRGKNITQQELVDGYAAAIENAINTLKIVPKIIEGLNQTIKHDQEITFKSNADIKDFQMVLLNGSEVLSSNYTLKEGSTIVTLNKDFVKTLNTGKYRISIVSSTGSANTEFTIIKPTKSNHSEMNTPETGDNFTMIFLVALLFVLSGGVLTLTLIRKYSIK